jgi:CheY-like chemotaxis protein
MMEWMAAAPSQPVASAADDETVLIVDDDASVLDALGELLESEGYAVVTALNGREALERLRGGLRPCVILLDLMMPVMDGWDFRQEQVKDRDLKDIPIVIVTAAGFSEASMKAQFGDIQLVPKPPVEEHLLEAIRRRRDEPLH